MLTQNEIDLLNSGYNLYERKNINKYCQIRIFSLHNKKYIISIYNNKTNNNVLLYNTTFNNIKDYINYIDSKKKIKNKRKKI